jgi:sRNA-binding regulator protein Hfq
MTFPDGNHRRQGKNPHGRPHGRPHGAGPRHAPHHPRRPHQPHPAPHPNQLPYGLPDDPGEVEDWIHPGGTGEEAAYLKGLVDSHTKVTVVLTDGEKFRGHIRYYDRDCFSIGLSAQGPRLLLRKEHVACIVED